MQWSVPGVALKIKVMVIKKIIAVLASLAWVGASAVAIDGSWRGELNLGQIKLPLVFNFKTANGVTTATLDSPNQGVKGVASDVVYCSSDSVAVDVPSIGAAFRGHIAGDSISGSFSQRGYTFPMTLTPERSLAERRPQTPMPPFPYTSVDTTFTAPDGAVLAATLTLPEGVTLDAVNDTPIVVMVTGSGPQNRDEELFEHRPFAVIADRLARAGIASLRYDDRGTAKSGGDFASSTTMTFKDDAGSAVDFARSLAPAAKVGILGHSEGGSIALLLAAEGKPDFVVSLAGMTVGGKDALMAQNRHTLDKAGITGQPADDSMRLVEAVFDHIASGASDKFDVDSFVAANNLEVPEPIMASVRGNVQTSSAPYMKELLNMRPADSLGDINCPVFAVNGTLDTQVASGPNLALIRELVRDARVKEYPGLNHMLQHAVTGESTEYGTITETISPEVLDDICAFITAL